MSDPNNPNNNDARKIRLDVSRFAPRRYRVPSDEAANQPVLERLSRGGPDNDSRARPRKPAPQADPIRERHVPSSPKLPLSVTGRVAVAMGLVVAVAAASAAVLRSKAEPPAAIDAAKAPPAKNLKAQARVQATDMPQPVHTVTIRPQTATAQVTSVQDAQPAAPHAETADALPAPLTTWAMFPDTAAAAATDGAKVEDAKKPEDVSKTEPADKKSEPTKEAAAKPAHVRPKAKAKRTARRARRHHRVRHRRVRTAAKPKPVQPAQVATQTPPAAPAPAQTNPLQAAINSIFHGGGGGSNGGASGGGASAPVGAAFQ